MKYGESNSLAHSIITEPLDNKENMFLYSVKIEDLEAARKYYYQIVIVDLLYPPGLLLRDTFVSKRRTNDVNQLWVRVYLEEI